MDELLGKSSGDAASLIEHTKRQRFFYTFSPLLIRRLKPFQKKKSPPSLAPQVNPFASVRFDPQVGSWRSCVGSGACRSTARKTAARLAPLSLNNCGGCPSAVAVIDEARHRCQRACNHNRCNCYHGVLKIVRFTENAVQ